jgi:hypothetical protein
MVVKGHKSRSRSMSITRLYRHVIYRFMWCTQTNSFTYMQKNFRALSLQVKTSKYLHWIGHDFIHLNNEFSRFLNNEFSRFLNNEFSRLIYFNTRIRKDFQLNIWGKTMFPVWWCKINKKVNIEQQCDWPQLNVVFIILRKCTVLVMNVHQCSPHQLKKGHPAPLSGRKGHQRHT